MRIFKSIVIVALLTSLTLCNAKEVSNKDSVEKESINQHSSDKDSKSIESNREVLTLEVLALNQYGNIKSNQYDNIVSKDKESTTKSPKGLKYYPQTREELFNLARDNTIYLGDIDTSKITDMSYLFADIPKDYCNDLKSEYENNKEDFIRSNTESYNLSYKEALKSVESILKACEYPERKDFSGIESWDTSSVTDMRSMFADAKSFNLPLNSWNVGRVTNMKSMFWGAESFNQNLESWGEKLRKYCNINYMFDSSPLASNPPKWYKERMK